HQLRVAGDGGVGGATGGEHGDGDAGQSVSRQCERHFAVGRLREFQGHVDHGQRDCVDDVEHQSGGGDSLAGGLHRGRDGGGGEHDLQRDHDECAADYEPGGVCL